MPITEAALKAINETLQSLDPAIQSLRNRKDINNPAAPLKVPEMVVFFQDYQQKLMICKAKDEQYGVVSLAADTQNTLIPKINEVMLSNTALSNMGQLNMKRTIEPKQALAQNVIFEKLLQSTMLLVASGQPVKPKTPPTLQIRAITYTSRHGGGNKLLRPNGVANYQRADGRNIQTSLDQSGGHYNNAEWDITRGGDAAAEPFSQTRNTPPAVTIVCRVSARADAVTVNGFAGRLDGAPMVYAGAQMLTNNFQTVLNQTAANPNTPLLVNAGAHVDFTLTFTGAQNFPNELAAAALALTLTVQTDAGNVDNTANSAGAVYLTFGLPAGGVQSLAANVFTLGGNPQDVTPARLALAIHAVRLGRNAIQAGVGVPTATGGVALFNFGSADDCVDAIFLFLKSRGITFSLGFRWVPGVNSTGLTVKPPLYTYLWMSLSPTPGVNAPGFMPRTEAWAECHNLAVAFALMGEILGLTPFVVNYGAGNQLGYATDYPQPRRQDIPPYNAQQQPVHGILNLPYSRQVVDPNGNVGRQQLCFIDQHNGVNNFEGVAVFGNVRLYPLGECILAENNRDQNADNYYCNYPLNPDYVTNANANANQGLTPLVFAGDWIQYFRYGYWIGWNWGNGYDPNPYPGVVVPIQYGATPGCFWWQN